MLAFTNLTPPNSTLLAEVFLDNTNVPEPEFVPAATSKKVLFGPSVPEFTVVVPTKTSPESEF